MLITNPIPINVERIADRPALIRGSGTPITGKKPRAIPH